MTARPLRVLSVSHSAVVGEYRKRYAAIVRRSAGQTTPVVLSPRHWGQFHREVAISGHEREPFEVLVDQPLSWGIRQQGLRNALHLHARAGRILRSVDPDILELWEEPFFLVTAQFLRLARRRRRRLPVVFFSAQNLARRYPPPFCWVERWVYRHADLCWAMSEEVVDVLAGRGWSRGKCRVLPLGYDPERFRPLAEAERRQRREDLFGAADGVLVAYLGRLDESKGLHDLLDATGLLGGADWRLLVVGGGPLTAEVGRRLAPMADAGRAKVLPAVANEQVPGLLGLADVVVMPSRTVPGVWKEQFGRVLVEAMACGAVPAGSDSGSIPEVIGEAGLVFPERDPRALAAALRRLVAEPALRADLRAKGLARAARLYTWDAVADAQLDGWRELSAGGPRP